MFKNVKNNICTKHHNLSMAIMTNVL